MAQRSPRDYIFRPERELDAELLRRAWDCVYAARAALALPRPSTFLGGREIAFPKKAEDEN